jgi:7-carboxy-7-deazaguanine synthase
MKISEIFYSIQGEGILAGVPSVFIRTSGCNLRCTWCDTPYASWKPDGYQMMYGPMLTEVRRHWCGHVVITGGEPMILPDLVELAEKIKEIDHHITIETAGTVYQKVNCDLMSISPKLSNSTPHDREGGKFAVQHEELRYQPDVLKQLIGEYNYQLKFVIASVDDVREARDVVREIGAERGRVLLMPEGTTRDVLADRAKWLVDVCKDFGYRYCPRLHIDIWGDKRGV